MHGWSLQPGGSRELESGRRPGRGDGEHVVQVHHGVFAAGRSSELDLLPEAGINLKHVVLSGKGRKQNDRVPFK